MFINGHFHQGSAIWPYTLPVHNVFSTTNARLMVRFDVAASVCVKIILLSFSTHCLFTTLLKGNLGRETFDDYVFVSGCPEILQPYKWTSFLDVYLRAIAQIVKILYLFFTLGIPRHVSSVVETQNISNYLDKKIHDLNR